MVCYIKNQHFKKVVFVICGQCFFAMPARNKYLDSGAQRAAIKLWKAKVPQRTFMKQLGMSTASLMRVLAFAKANPVA
jgi:hypothetical protein